MRKTALSLIAAAAMVAVSGAQAAPFAFLDDFSVGIQSLSSGVPGIVYDTAADAPITDVNRVLGIDVTTDGTPNASIEVSGGALGIAAAGTGNGGVAKYGIGYSGAAFAAYGAGTRADVSFMLTTVDLVPLNMELIISTFGGTVLATATASTPIGNGGTPVQYNFSNVGDYSQGFMITFAGPSAFDFSIDDLSFAIPEPGSLALVGLAMLGLGAARRKSAGK